METRQRCADVVCHSDDGPGPPGGAFTLSEQLPVGAGLDTEHYVLVGGRPGETDEAWLGD